MADERTSPRDDVQLLLRASGLELSGDELARVVTLHERFTAGRMLLAGVMVGETEPATTFQPSRPVGQP